MAEDEKVQITFQAKDELSKTLGSLRNLWSLTFGAVAVAATVKFFGECTKAAMESEKEFRLLDKALENTGETSKKTRDYINNLGESIMRKSGFNDEKVRAALRDLTNMTGNYALGVKYSATMTDLAYGANVSLETSAMLLARAYEGNVGILKRYGIFLKDGTSGTAALEEIQKKFAGNTETYMNTAAGKVDRLKNSWDELKESLGLAMAGPASEVLDAINSVFERTRLLNLGRKAILETNDITTEQGWRNTILALQNWEKMGILTDEARKKLIDYGKATKDINVALGQQAESIAIVKEQQDAFNAAWEKGAKELPELLRKQGQEYVDLGKEVGAAFGQLGADMIKGEQDMWQTFAKNILNMFINLAEGKLAVYAVEQAAMNSWGNVALAVAGVAGLEVLRAGGGALIDQGFGGAGTSATSTGATAATNNNSSGPAAQPVGAVTAGGGGGATTINIYLSNPTFLNMEAMGQAVDQLFLVAARHGWNVEQNPNLEAV